VKSESESSQNASDKHILLSSHTDESVINNSTKTSQPPAWKKSRPTESPLINNKQYGRRNNTSKDLFDTNLQPTTTSGGDIPTTAGGGDVALPQTGTDNQPCMVAQRVEENTIETSPVRVQLSPSLSLSTSSSPCSQSQLDEPLYNNTQTAVTDCTDEIDESNNSDYEDTDDTHLSPPLPPPRVKPGKANIRVQKFTRPSSFTRASSIQMADRFKSANRSVLPPPPPPPPPPTPPVQVYGANGRVYCMLPLPKRDYGAPPSKPTKPPNLDVNSWSALKYLDTNSNVSTYAEYASTYAEGAMYVDTWEGRTGMQRWGGTKARITKSVLGGFRRLKKHINRGK